MNLQTPYQTAKLSPPTAKALIKPCKQKSLFGGGVCLKGANLVAGLEIRKNLPGSHIGLDEFQASVKSPGSFYCLENGY
jgi:hypothetical protein